MVKSTEKNKPTKIPVFRHEVIEARSQRLLGDVIIIQPLSFKVLTALLVCIFVFAAVILGVGSYSKKETVYGFLMPDKGISKILIPGSGLVSEVFVEEGQEVHLGDPLVKVSLERSLSTGEGVKTQLIQLLKDQIDLNETQILEEQNQAKIRGNQLQNDISALEREVIQIQGRLDLQREITADAKRAVDVAIDLAEQGYVSQLDLSQRRNNFLSSQATEASLTQLLEQTQNSLGKKKSEFKAHPGLVENTINQLRAKGSELKQRLAEAEGERAFTIQAPIEGKVSGLQAYTGLNTTPTAPLLNILPKDSQFRAELFVPTRAIGLIQLGQEVRIFYDAFRYQSFGTYSGTVTQISKSILSPNEVSGPITPEEPVYRILVTLEKQNVTGFGETYPLQAGMTLEAVIILERQTFFEMILEPLKALKGKI